jgi:hypothetical protein
VDCSGTNGLVAGANGITINLNGFTITGNGASSGVLVNGHAGVVIENGTVDNFGDDIQIAATSTGAHVTNMRLSNAASYGISITASDIAVISGNYVLDDAVGTASGRPARSRSSRSREPRRVQHAVRDRRYAGGSVDGGGNVVQENGTAAQCQDIVCDEVAN